MRILQRVLCVVLALVCVMLPALDALAADKLQTTISALSDDALLLLHSYVEDEIKQRGLGDSVIASITKAFGGSSNDSDTIKAFISIYDKHQIHMYNRSSPKAGPEKVRASASSCYDCDESTQQISDTLVTSNGNVIRARRVDRLHKGMIGLEAEQREKIKEQLARPMNFLNFFRYFYLPVSILGFGANLLNSYTDFDTSIQKASDLGAFCGKIIVSVLMLVYFYKRKAVFYSE